MAAERMGTESGAARAARAVSSEEDSEAGSLEAPTVVTAAGSGRVADLVELAVGWVATVADKGSCPPRKCWSRSVST